MKIEDVKIGIMVTTEEPIGAFKGKNIGIVKEICMKNNLVKVEDTWYVPFSLKPYYKVGDKVRVLRNTCHDYTIEVREKIIEEHEKVNYIGWVSRVYLNRVVITSIEDWIGGNTFNYSDIEPWVEEKENNKFDIYSSCEKWYKVELYNGLQIKAILKMIGEKQLILENNNGLYVIEKNEIKLMFPVKED